VSDAQTRRLRHGEKAGGKSATFQPSRVDPLFMS
jgi:hypothetical protein